ncbi:putative methyltransferase-domain-containing protein [Lobosporangium transversale]|uniref:Putative methyltransferase-domain-containing protein n=1 Tax=Lobosporangium transversale TaxID=64571 RepID=A0A1Y2GMP8_9FUNG|nr:putative methyltransferase-domain-containing protein [Lobosporangium transversale]ORZ16030.1 putative methyltransferase-domain-containing protein [Lobosporangium transversale]|eukprot:XP_021881377.1 putative methyltransferase-domain-containing protein [Lobosporangium transversale]
MPLVLGPFNYTAGSFQSYDSNRVLRPISIPQGNGSNPRIMLLEETWNNVPQGRVWDSAFILKDIFTKQVQDRLEGSRPPIFAGKRILDLSAGTGLLGVFLAGLAQVEMDLLLLRGRPNATNRDGITNSSTTHISNAPPSTTVVLTDLEDAMELIQRNIASNKRRIAPNVSIEAKPLIWGSSPLTRLKADPFDVVIASDVVYQVDSFNSLLETLYDLCTPGHTTLYLGYKWRALDIDMERQFFEKLSAMFSVEKSLHDLEVQVWCLKR